MALVTAAAVAGTVTATAYLDAKFGIRKDIEGITRVKRSERDHDKQVLANRISPWYIIDEKCKLYWNRRAIWSRSGCYTYGEMHTGIARYANWLLEQDIKPGELVAMYLNNSPEFMIMWFACLCIGAAPAFINYNLEGKGLLHCLDVCETKLIIVDDDDAFRTRIEGSRADIEHRNTRIVYHTKQLMQEIAQKSPLSPGDEYRSNVKGSDPLCLIYTSGTTGLPKGCAFTISRFRLLGCHIKPPYECVPGVDCWYNSMPLYHGTGGITTSLMLQAGLSVAIAPRFSVSNFWPDIHDSGSTWFVYVGETARYLLSAPPHPLERSHRLRGAYGNGLRPDVWMKFRERFNVPEIAEFFNSTEGMFHLINYCKGPYLSACVGHHGLIARTLLHSTFIPLRIDVDTGDIYRDPATGRGQRMPYAEGGEIVVAVPEKEAFQGYWRAQAATDKKFVADVFKEGDLFYRTGDALRRTDDGRWLFLDRLGDTFRWKSENVSTAEVAEVLGSYPGVAEANVYGVLVPNHEGRAGCAAVLLEPEVKDSFDYSKFLKYARKSLPKYAVPVFLRVVAVSSHIHNHKQNKVPLRREGVDPETVGKEVGIGDRVLFVRPGGKTYTEFRVEDWEALKVGESKL
ncbi:fatty-acyl-CoA synthase [Aulographum hederae CBS 113979]|uniref:Very long-chain fatty acid transport protein n=1 Tax=Aulographum hederae CBS 113979 TaxID=1176131 RepID=A0A6G1HDT2_9PEZI|nr:fatty-acyl-CoA synthase [Aulographum hederae CBS 113979]